MAKLSHCGKRADVGVGSDITARAAEYASHVSLGSDHSSDAAFRAAHPSLKDRGAEGPRFLL